MASSNENTSNPFLALFTGGTAQVVNISKEKQEEINTDISPAAETSPAATKKASTEEATVCLEINNLIENVFLFTLDKEGVEVEHPDSCVYLREVHEALGDQDWLDVDTLEQALFERLMLGNPEDEVISTKSSAILEDAIEMDPLCYLEKCFFRLKIQEKESTHKDALEKCRELILRNSCMCFQHPDFFPNLNLAETFLDVFKTELSSSVDPTSGEAMLEFFDSVAVAINDSSSEGTVLESFRPIFMLMKKMVERQNTLGHGGVYFFLELMQFFTRKPCLAEAFLEYNQPQDVIEGHRGLSYEKTLVGTVLSIGCIPANELGPYHFFENPSRISQRESELIDNSIHQSTKSLNDRMHQLFLGLLRAGPAARHALLTWISNCLHENRGRAKLQTTHMSALLMPMFASDGFFTNLCAVLLRLCTPFSEPTSPKLLKVQPTYCLATRGQREQVRNRNVHMHDISEETSLVPKPDEGSTPIQLETEYNFISECFYMTHYAIHLGIHVVAERFLRLNRDMHRIQELFRDLRRQGAENSELGQRIQQQMDKRMTMFLCLKAALTEPVMLEALFSFNIATATWLVQVASHDDLAEFREVTFPLPNRVSPVLSCVPEFVTENLVDYLVFVRRFKESLFEQMVGKLEWMVSFILVFMGSRERMSNPHLRAKLAEALEALLPPKNPRQGSLLQASLSRELVFRNHKHISQLAEVLLKVFVSIEMTGQAVEFELKFGYRRPMYTILDYIFDMEVHRDSMKKLSQEAMDHIDHADAPLFLRFINLLINDATFLLDEALDYMSQIKKKEEERDSEEWAQLPADQRQEKEQEFRQIAGAARSFNILGNETIHTVTLLTSDIKDIFVHRIMLERIAPMLNYYLKQLVGPKTRELKVKRKEDYQFNPQDTVSNICKICLNLSESEEFCLALASDDRSYSHELYERVERVLYKIYSPYEMITAFHELAQKVKGKSKMHAIEDELVDNAPDEYLDSLMGTLMRDPVCLPESKKIVDRSTIARHLLSDQTDPFNRQPLTMEQVESLDELKQEIEEWIDEQIKQRQSS